MNRQRLILAGLVAVLAASLLYAFWAMPRQEKAPPRAITSKATAGKAKVAKPMGAEKGDKPPKAPSDRLQLQLLNQEPSKFPEPGRDIFHFVERAAPVIAVEQVVVAPPPPPPLPPPTPEEILRGLVSKFTFLGFLDKGGSRTVFLSSGEDVFLVKAGEWFGKDKELIVKEITPKQLVVGWGEGPETVKVQLLENEKLQPMTISGSKTGQESTPVSGGALGGRPGSGGATPRRVLMPQRAPSKPPSVEEPAPEEPAAEVVDQSKPKVSLEELLKKGLPSVPSGE